MVDESVQWQPWEIAFHFSVGTAKKDQLQNECRTTQRLKDSGLFHLIVEYKFMKDELIYYFHRFLFKKNFWSSLKEWEVRMFFCVSNLDPYH